jgi:hypothetical protein
MVTGVGIDVGVVMVMVKNGTLWYETKTPPPKVSGIFSAGWSASHVSRAIQTDFSEAHNLMQVLDRARSKTKIKLQPAGDLLMTSFSI